MSIDAEVSKELVRVLDVALREDIRERDITTSSLPIAGVEARGEFLVKTKGVLAGFALLPLLSNVPFVQERGLSVDNIDLSSKDGDFIEAGTTVATLRGDAAALLMLERSMLNLIAHLSGVATLTRQFVDAVDGTGAKICDTRKTLPGVRVLQKYAVACGGGHNHRMGLFDEAMIKENHLSLSGVAIKGAVAKVRDSIGPDVTLTCETENLEEFEAILNAPVDIIMLDEFSLDDLRTAVGMRNEQSNETPLLEASGGVNLDTVRAIAETGVDRISIGALTHSAPQLDISFKIFREDT